jgi:glycosyltransferase involved in cell wall biosynthesis
MDFAPDELILLSTNRLVKYKGIEILINALALLPDQLNLTVLFVGNDDKANEGKALETKLKTLNAKKKNLEIILEGKQPYSIMNKYYKVADIYTLNSFREGMSNSLLEAMSSSLPVIVSDIKANTSLIRDGYNGLVYARENAMDLNKAIRELAANTELRLTYGNNNREKILKEFCKKKVINSYVELLEAN